MKKRNLLTLTALCMSVGLVLTSCQGAQGPAGTNGTDGKDGVNGTDGKDGNDGEDGKDGLPGKTMLPVISLLDEAALKDKGLTFTQDKFFVEVGETFTFTFTPLEGSTVELLDAITINGKEINIEPGTWNYSYKALETDKGFQLSDASFGTVKEYLAREALALYNEYATKDKALATIKADLITITEASGTDVKYKDRTLADLTVAAANTELVVDEKDSATEKFAVAEKALEDLEKDLAEKHAALIKASKIQATTDIKDLFAKIGENDARDAKGLDKVNNDRLIALATGEVTAAPTLNALNDNFKKWNGVEKSDGSRFVAYGKITAAYNTEVATDNGFTLESAGTPKAEIKKLIEDYNLPEAMLPHKIRDSYVKKLAAATTKTELEAIAKEAEEDTGIKDSIKKIRAFVSESIINTYIAEINKSTVSNASQKTSLGVLVTSLIENWVADTNKLTGNMGSLESTGLLGAVETALADEAKYNGVGVTSQFVAWRMGTYKTASVAKLKARRDELIASDSIYASALATKKVENEDEAQNATIGLEGAKVNNSIWGSDILDVNKIYTAGKANVEAQKTVLTILTEEGEELTKLTTGFGAAKDAYVVLQKDLVSGGIANVTSQEAAVGKTDKWSNTNLKAAWDTESKGKNAEDQLVLKSFDGIAKATLKINKILAQVTKLNTAISTWYSALTSGSSTAGTPEKELADGFKPGNSLWDATFGEDSALIKKINAGSELATSEITTYVNNLLVTYKGLVKAHYDLQEENITLIYNALFGQATSADKLTNLRLAYKEGLETLKGFVGTDGNLKADYDTVTEIDTNVETIIATLTAAVA